MLTINIIGAGNVGKTIAHLFHTNQIATIKAVCNTSELSTMQALQFIGAGNYCSSITSLPAADITFIATNDASIAPCCVALSQNQHLQKDSTVAHFSGTLNSDVLEPLKKQRCHIASIHPMRSFINPTTSAGQYVGTYCAMEGDTLAISTLEPLFTAIGSLTYTIHKDKKSLYHAAGVFASNYVVALAQQALTCLTEAGLKKSLAMPIIHNLMQSVVANLGQASSPEQALTGPIARGEIGVIKAHMQGIQDPVQKKLYTLLGRATLSLTSHDETTRQCILDELEKHVD